MSNDGDKSETWTQRIAWAALVAIVLGGTTWASWISIELNNKLDCDMLLDISAYSVDKQLIKNEIATLKRDTERMMTKVEGKFADTLDANTQAIIQLKEQMRYNNMILERIIKKIDGSIEP